MNVLFDTSVLVASIWAGHPKHRQALDAVEKAREGKVEGGISQHTLLEAFSVLTRMPSNPRLGPALVRSAITKAISGLQVIELTKEDYLACLEAADSKNLHGGVVYDLLILRSAAKANADELLTLNERDFERAKDRDSPRVSGL